MPSQTIHLSSDHLRQALQLREQIDSLQQRLNSILGRSGATTGSTVAKPTTGGSSLKGRKLSPATLRKMRAAQQARWAKIKGGKGSTEKSGGASKTAASASKKKSGGMTPEQRARISATLKARWAAKKKADTKSA